MLKESAVKGIVQSSLERLYLALLIAAQHSNNASSGGSIYRSTISSSFSMNRGSRDTLN